MDKYQFRLYDVRYPGFFDEEKARIINAIGDDVCIEHVGSTAIPGLGGKGIVDIAVGIDAIDGLGIVRDQLVFAGYDFREVASTSGRFFLRRDYPCDHIMRRIHLHLVAVNSCDWCEMIDFRNYLLSHPDAVETYAAIKKEAVAYASGDGEKYKEYKKNFIDDILAHLLDI